MRAMLGRLLEVLGEPRIAAGPHHFEEAAWGPTPAEAREAFAYWSSRARRLPWYRLRERREARELAARWHRRLREARAARYGRGPLGSLAALAVDGALPRSPHSPLRRLAIGVTAVGVLTITTVVVTLGASLAFVVHLLNALVH